MSFCVVFLSIHCITFIFKSVCAYLSFLDRLAVSVGYVYVASFFRFWWLYAVVFFEVDVCFLVYGVFISVLGRRSLLNIYFFALYVLAVIGLLRPHVGLQLGVVRPADVERSRWLLLSVSLYSVCVSFLAFYWLSVDLFFFLHIFTLYLPSFI